MHLSHSINSSIVIGEASYCNDWIELKKSKFSKFKPGLFGGCDLNWIFQPSVEPAATKSSSLSEECGFALVFDNL